MMHSHNLPQNTGDTQTLSQLSSSWRKFNTNSRGGEERFYFISFLSSTSSSYFVPLAAIITNTTWSWNCCLLRLRSLSHRLEETRHEPIVIGPSSSSVFFLSVGFIINSFPDRFIRPHQRRTTPPGLVTRTGEEEEKWFRGGQIDWSPWVRTENLTITWFTLHCLCFLSIFTLLGLDSVSFVPNWSSLLLLSPRTTTTGTEHRRRMMMKYPRNEWNGTTEVWCRKFLLVALSLSSLKENSVQHPNQFDCGRRRLGNSHTTTTENRPGYITFRRLIFPKGLTAQ